MLKLSAENIPQVVIFEGDQTKEKANALKHLAAEILFEHRRETTDTKPFISKLVAENQHPDLIEFVTETVAIGSEKDPLPGTVRHLMRRVLPYAPWKANARVVLFQNAQGINNEAETALLKTLEEPPENNYFFMSVQTAEAMRETVRSRSMITRSVEKHLVPEGMRDPWMRFYYLMNAHDFFVDYPEAAERIVQETKEAFDTMAFSTSDFAGLERILFTLPRQLFEKEMIAVQNRAFHFALLPLWAALRDRATQGMVAPLAPIVLNHITPLEATRAAERIQTYLRNLSYRVFGTRALTPSIVFYAFFSRFFPLWSKRSEGAG